MMIPCSWESDGSAGCEQLHVSDRSQDDDGYTKISVTATGGSPVNLMATLTSIPDTYWFQVRIVDKGGSISVGVVTPEEFLPGYKTKGMFYNGNLTNGSAALKTGYGPYLKSGDWVVLECTHWSRSDAAGSAFAMTVYVNGHKIGRGFEVTTAHADQKFMPCLAVNGKADLLVQVLEQQPDLSAAEVAMHPLEGKWKVVNAKKDTKGQDHIIPIKDDAGNDLPNQRDIIMDITPETSSAGEPSFRVSVKVFNNLSVRMRYTTRPDQTIFDVKAMEGPVMTMMMSPPPYNLIERELAKTIVENWQSFRLQTPGNADEGNELIITTINNRVMAHCVRFSNDNDGPALTKYHH